MPIILHRHFLSPPAKHNFSHITPSFKTSATSCLLAKTSTGAPFRSSSVSNSALHRPCHVMTFDVSRFGHTTLLVCMKVALLPANASRIRGKKQQECCVQAKGSPRPRHRGLLCRMTVAKNPTNLNTARRLQETLPSPHTPGHSARVDATLAVYPWRYPVHPADFKFPSA